ncbi:MAG: hypothetical protein ACTHLH_10015 [Solirubrobacterales bacterium]
MTLSGARILVPFAVLLAMAGVSACGSTPQEGSASGANEAGWIPGLEGVKSGEVEASLSVNDPGGQGQLYVRLVGTFLGAGEGEVPRVDMGAEARGQMHGEDINASTALITGLHRAALTYDGKVYEMGPHVFDPVLSSFEQALGDRTAADMYACLEATDEIDLSEIAGATVKQDPNATAIDGSRVTATTAKLEPAALSLIVHKLIEDSGCGAQLRLAGSLGKDLAVMAKRLERDVQKGEVITLIDKGGIRRELEIHAVLDSKRRGRSEVAFHYWVSHVNEIDKLPGCTGEETIQALIEKLGFNPLQAIEAGQPGLAGLLKGIYARALA